MAGAIFLVSACRDDATRPQPPAPASIMVEHPTVPLSWVDESHRLRVEAQDDAGALPTEAVVS